MRILIDTNVILDALTGRQPHFDDADKIIKFCADNSRKVKLALNRGDFKDLEDCIQDECAAAIKADYIVTRNKKDFENSIVPAILPQEFLDMIESR